MQSNHRNHSRLIGISLVLISTIFFSISGIFTKLIASDAWTVATWRGFFGTIIMMLYIVFKDRMTPLKAVASLGWKGWVFAAVGSVSSFAFILAFKLTYVANVAIIYATVPFMAALLERIMLGVHTQRNTMILAGASLIGVCITMWGGIGTGSAAGNWVAIFMTFGMALYMVLIRMFGKDYAIIAGAVSAFQLFFVGLFLINPLDVSLADFVLLIMFGASFAVAVIFWTEGTLRISAAESGFLGTAELPLAIVFAWLILTEIPPVASLVGGSIVLLAIFIHSTTAFAPTKHTDKS